MIKENKQKYIDSWNAYIKGLNGLRQVGNINGCRYIDRIMLELEEIVLENVRDIEKV